MSDVLVLFQTRQIYAPPITMIAVFRGVGVGSYSVSSIMVISRIGPGTYFCWHSRIGPGRASERASRAAAPLGWVGGFAFLQICISVRKRVQGA